MTSNLAKIDVDNDIAKYLPQYAPDADQSVREDIENAKKLPFLPNITLLHDTSQDVKDKKAEAGTFVLGGSVNLGDSFRMFVITYRHHAFISRKFKKDDSTETFTKDSPEWNRVVATKKQGTEVDPRYGPEFLVYLPDYNQFAMFFPGKNSDRPVGGEILTYIRPREKRHTAALKKEPETQFMRVHSESVTRGYTYLVPVVTPIEFTEENKEEAVEWCPSREQAIEAAKMFVAPMQKEASTEEATEEDQR